MESGQQAKLEAFDVIDSSCRARKPSKPVYTRRSMRSARNRRRMTSKSKLLYLEKLPLPSASSDEKNMQSQIDTEIYEVMLKTLWSSTNFRERFVGVDNPSRGRYKWQHNCPPGEENMNIFIALKDIFLQYHGRATARRQQIRALAQCRLQYLHEMERFLEIMRYGFEAHIFDKKQGSTELCYVSVRRVGVGDMVGSEVDGDLLEAKLKNESLEPAKTGTMFGVDGHIGDCGQDENGKSEKEEKDDPKESEKFTLEHEDDIFNHGYVLVFSYLDREIDVVTGKGHEFFIPFSTLRGVKMRVIDHVQVPKAQIRIKHGKKLKSDILLPIMDEDMLVDSDMVTPELFVKGLEMALGGMNFFQQMLSPDVDFEKTNLPAVGRNVNFHPIFKTMLQIYTSRLNRGADVIFDVLASLYCSHHGIVDLSTVVRGLEAMNVRHKKWWQPCVLKVSGGTDEYRRIASVRSRLNEDETAFGAFIIELFVTWNDSPTMPDQSWAMKRKQRPAPFLPPGLVSFWHDVDVVDALDVSWGRSSEYKGMSAVMRHLLEWRAFFTDLNNANVALRQPRFHLLHRPPTFLVRLKWPPQPRSWSSRLTETGCKFLWDQLRANNFEIDLLHVFDTVGAQKKTRALTRRAEQALYRIKQIVCFSVTGQFYSFKSASAAGEDEWFFLSAGDYLTSTLTFSEIEKLCKLRGAFPELVFYEDTQPGLYAARDAHRKERLGKVGNFSQGSDLDEGPVFVENMTLVPCLGDSSDHSLQLIYLENGDSGERERLSSPDCGSTNVDQQWCHGCISF